MHLMEHTQANHPISLVTPLGKDILVLTGFSGNEGISELFHFQMRVLAPPRVDVPFERLLGQEVTIRMDLGIAQHRFFSGMVYRVNQGEPAEFTPYYLHIAPTLWLLTKRTNSRIFQHLSVPEILKEVLTGLPLKTHFRETYEPRNYCVQYRESDFDFISRLMEEEGIHYYFTHSEQGHELVLSDSALDHPDIPGLPQVVFARGSDLDPVRDRVFRWGKAQEIRPGKYTLWDHHFELPGDNLEAARPGLESVPVGSVSHQLNAGPNGELENYQYPGAFAHRFDGVDKGGGDQNDELAKVFEDNQRTVAILSQQESMPGIVISGAGYCADFISGHRFTLAKHPHADGSYLLTRVTHHVSVSNSLRAGVGASCEYHNTFTCIPTSLPYRHPRVTPKPEIHGTQTATVVGPAGEEIFTDKYGRVKVQFHWDRLGQRNADSSCWVRVSQIHAGRGWGGIDIPRVGEEVVISFLEGDPDRPLIIGRVYNAEAIPPFPLPDHRMVSGMKSSSYPGGEGFNMLIFDDSKAKEQILVHAQHNMQTMVLNNRADQINVDDSETIGQNQNLSVGKNRSESIGADNSISVGGNQSITVSKDRQRAVDGGESIAIAKDQALSVTGGRSVSVGKDQSVNVTGNNLLDVGKILAITAGDAITLTCGSSSMMLANDGTITIKGANITLEGSGVITVNATSTLNLKGSTIKAN